MHHVNLILLVIVRVGADPALGALLPIVRSSREPCIVANHLVFASAITCISQPSSRPSSALTSSPGVAPWEIALTNVSRSDPLTLGARGPPGI